MGSDPYIRPTVSNACTPMKLKMQIAVISKGLEKIFRITINDTVKLSDHDACQGENNFAPKR